MTGAQRQTTKYEVQKQTHKKYVIKVTCEASAERTGDQQIVLEQKPLLGGKKGLIPHVSISN